MTRLLCVLLCCCSAFTVTGQGKSKKKNSALLIIGEKEISPTEFIYLFEKNHNAESGKYDDAEIESYLDLFIRFKLKVEEARARGLDTTREFVAEYTTYRDELLKPYLPNTRLTDSLVTLTYERLQEEVRASHILISVKKDAMPADTLEAFQRAVDLLGRIRQGEDFRELATTVSDDPSAQTNHGDLGYFTALQMVYPFETAAYTTAAGEVAGPVRTAFGYHLVKVTDRRPARGEVEVSHIMLRNSGAASDTANQSLIFEIYDQLSAGASWDELCSTFSQDQTSRENGGRLRPFGVRAMASAPPFEDVAFSLSSPGDVSDPFQTRFGWHIVRLERKLPTPPLVEIRSQLQSQVTKDERFEIAREVWEEKLKVQMGYSENPEAIRIVEAACANGDCGKVDGSSLDQPLFRLEGRDYDIRGFLKFVQALTPTGEPNEWRVRLEAYKHDALMDNFEKRISEENSTFSMLSREYYEGILLFEIMEEEVWNKAAQDTIGQRSFYENNLQNYLASERVEATFYTSSDSSFRVPLKPMLAGEDSSAIWALVEKLKIGVESGIFERSERPFLAKVPWEEGIFGLEDNGMYYLASLERILPAGRKSFEEAKAAIVNDYQQKIEDDWIEQLRRKYPVKVNEKVRQYVLEQLRAE